MKRRPNVEQLETRRLLALAYPDNYEQYMVELINRARQNPQAEAIRYNIDLNEGVKPTETKITTDPKQPLAFNPHLDDAAQSQANWLLLNSTLATFSHSGPGGNQPADRMANSGYKLTMSDQTLENAAVNLYGFLGEQTALTTSQHQAYFVDTQNADGGRGHRLQMMAINIKEVGAGIVTGSYQYNNTTYQAFLSVIDFAEHNSLPYLTGVAYTDAMVHDSFYTPGEGLGGVTVAAVRSSDGKTFSTKTWASGGYTIALDPGTYTVYGYGGSLGGTQTYGNVTVTSQNVKRDFTPAQATDAPPFALLAGGVLTVNGTSGDDKMSITSNGSNYTVARNGTLKSFAVADVNSIEVDLGAGNDNFVAGTVLKPMYILGGLGNDSIGGGLSRDTISGAGGNDLIDGNAADDRLNGGAGKDTLIGNIGDDRIYGGDGNDVLYGDSGVDRLFGEAGNDTLDGGSSNDKLYGGDGDDSLTGGNQDDLLHGDAGNDTLVGEKGNDVLVGGAGIDSMQGNDGNDSFDAKDGLADVVLGGAGTDHAALDSIDIRQDVEVIS